MSTDRDSNPPRSSSPPSAARVSRWSCGRREATPETMKSAIRQVVGEAAVKPGKIKLDLPPLVENGNTVAMAVIGRQPDDGEGSRQGDPRLHREEPAAERHQRQARARAPARPKSRPACGSPTRRPVIAICEMSDGSFWSDKVDVIITLGACLEDPV